MSGAERQIIAFIRRDVFCDNWLSDVRGKVNLGNFNNTLGNGQFILYVKPTGAVEVAPYDADKANASLYVLIPDDCNAWRTPNLHTPTVPFKFIWHSKTDQSMYEGYNELKNCVGFKGSEHETETPYHALAMEVVSVVDDNAPNPQPILEMITDKPWIENAKQALVPLCQNPNNVVQLINNINNCDATIRELLLLENCEIYNWIRNNSVAGRLDMDELRKFLGIQ